MGARDQSPGLQQYQYATGRCHLFFKPRLSTVQRPPMHQVRPARFQRHGPGCHLSQRWRTVPGDHRDPARAVHPLSVAERALAIIRHGLRQQGWWRGCGIGSDRRPVTLWVERSILLGTKVIARSALCGPVFLPATHCQSLNSNVSGRLRMAALSLCFCVTFSLTKYPKL